ncbi:MAG: hypothetical protein ACM338_01935, partial [Betaproteobacteria bacterium]
MRAPAAAASGSRPPLRMTQGLILNYLQYSPEIGDGAALAASGAIVGRSTVGARPVLAAYATLRADGESIRVGANAWFGEHATVHIADSIMGAVIGNDVTVARHGLVHACVLGAGVVVGESAVVMDGASVGPNALIAADSVVPPRKALPGGFVYAGHPARPVRAIDPAELAGIARDLRAGVVAPLLASTRLPQWTELVSRLPDGPGPLRAQDGRSPTIARAYVAPTAVVAGAVDVAGDSSVFFGCAVSAGDGRIVIGTRSNVQDNSLLATDRRRGDLVLGTGVTIGHNVEIGSALIGNDVLIGMGSRLGDEVVVEAGACIAAGAWVDPGTVVPAGWIWAGRPARAFREIKDSERREFARAGEVYVRYAGAYRSASSPG